MELNVPKIVNNIPKAKGTLVVNQITGGTSANRTAIGYGSWIQLDNTYGLIACVSADTYAKYVVIGIYDAGGERLNVQYVTAAQLVANTYLFEVIPIGGLIFEMTEDGLTTPITNANSTVYADIIVTAPTEPKQLAMGLPGIAMPIIQIDSNTVNASSSGLLLQLLGLAPGLDNPAYSATAGSQRNFYAKVIDAVAQEAQSTN